MNSCIRLPKGTILALSEGIVSIGFWQCIPALASSLKITTGIESAFDSTLVFSTHF